MNAILGFDLSSYDRTDVKSIRLGTAALPQGISHQLGQFSRIWDAEYAKLQGAHRADGKLLEDREIQVVAVNRARTVAIDRLAKQWRADHDRGGMVAEELKEFLNLQVRADDYAGGSGFSLPLSNVFVVKPLLDEPLPEQTSFQFLKNRPVPAWKDFYAIGRRKHAGQAAFWNGGNTGIPVANSSANYEQHPLFTIVTSYQIDLTKAMKLEAQGVMDKAQLDRESAYYALRQLMNYSNWSGNDPLALPGILNYPGQPQIESATIFNPAASADAVLKLLNTWMNYNFGIMAGIPTLVPNHVRFSPKLWATLAGMNYTTSQGQGATVLDVFMMNQERISRGLGREITFGISPELEATGPSGKSGILFINTAMDSASYVNPMQIAELPPQVNNFQSTHVVYARYGGYAAPNAAANLLVWVPLS